MNTLNDKKCKFCTHCIYERGLKCTKGEILLNENLAPNCKFFAVQYQKPRYSFNKWVYIVISSIVVYSIYFYLTFVFSYVKY